MKIKLKIENPRHRRISLRLTKSKIRIIFIGAGNMTEAMVRGILKTGLYRPGNIRVTDIDTHRLDFFQRELGVAGTADNQEAVSMARTIVLAVKPQQAPQVLAELRGKLANNPLLISIITGFSIKKIMAAIDQPARIIRVVPNTPALVGSGASAYCCGKGTKKEDKHLAESILKSIGTAIRLDEPLLNAATALSGSGPAYVFYLIEALMKAGREIGLAEETARRLIIATVVGSARLLSETGRPPAELRRRVTSRGGTTEAAMEILNKKGTQRTIIAAVKAAHKRAKELSS
ncbi:MAG: pyrroline-5-carboxylate reductase [Kiritimatiellia bacterium]|nr:pyrroline-5-carboxylate reductase [Kiritimatiellia bacterium]